MKTNYTILASIGFCYILLLFQMACTNTVTSKTLPETQKTKDKQENQPNYKLVWADEFDYEGLPDSTKWGYDQGNGCNQPPGCGWGNRELQYYTNRLENAYVADGHLTIVALKKDTVKNKYTSARLHTKNKGDFKYGKIEVRAKLPAGVGTWPAIWMLSTEDKYKGWPNSGEIDIMEHVGFEPNVVHGTVHTKSYNHSIGTQKGKKCRVANTTTAFHNYGIEWDENKIVWFVDDKKYYTFEKRSNKFEEWPFDQSFHILLNVAIGGFWGGIKGVNDKTFPQEMVVDYVRVYQK